MSTLKEFPRLKKSSSCDVVEPPLKKFCSGDSQNSKVTESVTELSEQLDLIENIQVTELSEQLDLIESVTELSKQLDVTENIQVTESLEQLDVIDNIKVTESLERLDVISFLSNNGKTNYLVRSNGEFVDLNFIRGKHLIIWSVSLPFPCVEMCTPFWRVIAATYSDLSQAGYEMVFSVTVKKNKKLRFDNFLSTLPCLAIPFPDLDTRNSVSSFIHTNYKIACSPEKAVIVVDPTGLIVTSGCNVPLLFHKYGCEWLIRNVDDLEAEVDVLKIRLDPFYKIWWEDKYIGWPGSVSSDVIDQPLSLHKDFLLCDPSRVLSRFDNQSLPVSELSKKHVALYLCLTGNFMKQLNKVYKQCLENNQELEVVLVCMPYLEEPKLYYHNVTELLKRYDIKSWFIFPFDNKVCFRLRRAFCSQSDKLIILPPNCKSSGDMLGRAVIDKLGITSYPFTRSAVLEQRFNTLKSVTTASFFQGSSKKYTCLVRNGKNSNVRHSEIKGRKLILYLDLVGLSSDDGRLCRLLLELYPELQAKGCEVVFVPLDKKAGSPRHGDLAKMPWPIMPVEAAIKAAVPDNFIFRNEYYVENFLVVFGEDGKILSRWIKATLMKYGVTKMIFGDYVREEISHHLDLLEEVIDYF